MLRKLVIGAGRGPECGRRMGPVSKWAGAEALSDVV